MRASCFTLYAPRGSRGQFIPIAAMVMFTTVVFLMAVIDIYQISRAKLKAQNLADAAALNVATQMAGSINKVADLNEWMNHMVNLGSNVPQSLPGQAPNCKGIDADLPPISCAENATKSSSLNIFSLKGNAANYAGLVQKINLSQQMFINAYNNFIGAGTGSNSSISSNSSLRSILMTDIPDLGQPGTTVIIWNQRPPTSESVQAAAAQTTGATPSVLNTAAMQPLKFKINDIPVTYKTVIQVGFGASGTFNTVKTLGQLLSSSNNNVSPVGWMEPDTTATPQIQVTSANGTETRVGAGAQVILAVRLPVLGSTTVSAKAQAYVVENSGTMGIDPTVDPLRPVFKPTYWVKLVGT